MFNIKVYKDGLYRDVEGMLFKLDVMDFVTTAFAVCLVSVVAFDYVNHIFG